MWETANAYDLPLEGPADPQPCDMVSCPCCGETDTLENAIREAGEHATQKMAESIRAMVKNSVRESDFIKVTSRDIPKKSYRFVTDYEPGM